MNQLGKRRYWLASIPAALVALALGIAGTVEARDKSPTATSAATSNLAAHQVQVRDFSYTPNQIVNLVNDPVTITVTNAGPTAHTFTIAGVADSGAIQSGQSRTVTFTPTQAGNLTFYCTIHGQGTMSGLISVMNPATNPVQPSQQQPAPPPSTQQPPVQQPAPPPRQVIMQPPSTGDAGLLADYAD